MIAPAKIGEARGALAPPGVWSFSVVGQREPEARPRRPKIGEARGALAPLGCGAFPLSANANRKRGRGSTLSTLRRAQRASREPYVHSPQPCQRPGTAPTPRQTPL